MDGLQTVATDEVPYFTLSELKEIQLGTLIPAALKMGLEDASAAKRDTIVGMVFVAQRSYPDTVLDMRTKLRDMAHRHTTLAAAKREEEANHKPRERSAVGGAVGKVHEICNKMKGQSRAAVIEACVKAGINKNTAKTQYYKWSQAQ